MIALSGALAARAPQDGPTASQALREELALANRILANEAVLDGYGHERSQSGARRPLLSLALEGSRSCDGR